MEAFTMRLFRSIRDWRVTSAEGKTFAFWSKPAVLVATACLLSVPSSLFPIPAHAQSPTYGVGRIPGADEIRAWDLSIGPEGKELPPGRGTAKQGEQLFVQKGCFACHGQTGSNGPAPTLIKSDGKTKSTFPCLTPCVNDSNVMALHSPYATTLWDYIRRGMPLNKEGTLTPDEVYSLTAFLLYKNGVIPEDQVIDREVLPKIKMPNRDGFVLPPEWKHGTPRLQNYP